MPGIILVSGVLAARGTRDRCDVDAGGAHAYTMLAGRSYVRRERPERVERMVAAVAADERANATDDAKKRPDDREPSVERQAELRAAYEANIAAGIAPYADVEIGTRGELNWVLRERDWSSNFFIDKVRPDLSGATLRGAN